MFAKCLPANNDLFETLHVSQQQLESFRDEVQHALNEAMAECNKLQISQTNERTASWPIWKVQAQLEGLRAFTRIDDEAPTSSTSRICGSIPGDYVDIARFFMSKTREQYFNVQKRLFPDTVDAAVLYTVPPETRHQDRAEGIKWAAYRPAWRRNLIDACAFESAGTAVSSDGQPFFYCVLIPTAMPGVPTISPNRRTVRIECRSVMIISPSSHSTNRSDLFMTMFTDLKDQRLPRGFHKRLLTGLHDVGASIASMPSQNYSQPYTLHNGKWICRNPQRSCQACLRAFSILRTKHKCMLCGEVVCRKCLLEGEQNPHSSLVPIKVCMPCMSQLCDQDPQDTQEFVNRFYSLQAITPTLTAGISVDLSLTSERSPQNNDPDWDCSTPTPKTMYGEQHRSTAKSSTDDLIQAKISALSSQSFYSSSPGKMHPGGRKTHEDPVYEGRHWCFYGDDDGEDDCESSSDVADRASSVYVTIDTREMERVDRQREAPSYGRESPSLFHSIGSSLREQSKLLQQLQRVRRQHSHTT